MTMYPSTASDFQNLRDGLRLLIVCNLGYNVALPVVRGFRTAIRHVWGYE